MDENKNNAENSEQASCDSSLTRQEFMKQAAKAILIAGGAMAAPKILDKFLVPPAYAIGTRMSAPGSASDQPTGYGTDTSMMNPAA